MNRYRIFIALVSLIIVSSLGLGVYLYLNPHSLDGGNYGGFPQKPKEPPKDKEGNIKDTTSAKEIEVAPDEPTLVVQLTKDEISYTAPGKKSGKTVPKEWYGSPSSLPVLAQERNFVKVRLAQRPNGATTWIRLDPQNQKLYQVNDWIRIDLSKKELTLFHKGKKKFKTKVGIGKDETPTPKGMFFVTFLSKTPDASYGPFMLVLSAHSEKIQSYGGINDAIVAIHGPLGSDVQVARGARLSDGCIRMPLDDLKKLKKIYPGTPVEIVA